MQIPGVTDTSSIAQPNTAPNRELDENAFMQLLVTQLQNQDPLEPLQNEDFVAQLANFSSLEQLETLNQNMLGMIALNQANELLSQLTQGSALIGKDVNWFDPETNATQTGSVESIKIEDGLAIVRIDGQDVPLGNVVEILGNSVDDTGSGGDPGNDGSDAGGEGEDA